MTEEKKESKCCGCCEKKNKELNSENLDKVTGGTTIKEQGKDARLVNGKYICKSWKVDEGFYSGITCNKNKTVDGVENVCTCIGKTDGNCCRVFGNKCTCRFWYSKGQKCVNENSIF